MPVELGAVASITLEDPAFSSLLWKLSPASMAVRLSGGQFRPWNYVELLSRKLMDVAAGRCKRLIVCMAPRVGKDLDVESIVQMADGSVKRLGDVVVGDMVVTHGSRGRRVLEIFERPNRIGLRMTTKTGRTVVPEWSHPMFTSLGEQRACDIKVGQGLAMLRNFEANRMSERSLKEFRLAGYFIGDGCTKQEGRSVVAVIDPIEKDDVVECLASVGSTCKIYTDAVYAHKPGANWTKAAGLQGKGAHQKEIPSWAFNASNEQIAHLLGAYFATDGAITDSSRTVKDSVSGKDERVGCSITYGSVSKKLLEQTQSLLARLDIVSRLRVKNGTYKGKRHTSWILCISDRRSLLNFFEQIPVKHSKKMRKIDEWSKILIDYPSVHPQLTIEQVSEVANSTLPYRTLAAKYNVGDHIIWNIQHGIGKNLPHSELYFYDEVVSIEKVEGVNCRCLTVDEDSTFVANGFVVHNSELVSKYFIIWYLEHYQDRRIILASYEADFAAKFGGKVRDIILENQDILSVRFKVKNPAMHFLETTENGVLMTAGAGGPITGKGANVFLIDDPIKGSEDASSLTMREKCWDWFTSTARSRLEPGGSMVVIATRWNSDDLIGRILKKEKENIEKAAEGDRNAQPEGWEVFTFPALAEPETERHYFDFKVPVNQLRAGAISGRGLNESIRETAFREANPAWVDFLGRHRGDPLCPDRFNSDDYAKLRSISERDWVSLYQQRPGDFVDDGNVYYAFNEVVNCRPIVRDERKQLFASFDFNCDPGSIVLGQYDRGGGIRQMERMEVLEEIVLQNSNTAAMMERLLQVLREKYSYGYELNIEVYGDAAGTQRTANSSKSNWQLVAEYFSLVASIHYTFRRRRANPTISDRVNAVNAMLRSADGTSRLFVNDLACSELVKDLKKVKWQVDPGGNTTGLLDKSDKHRTHISDALGYAVEFLFSLKTKGGGKKGIMQ